MSRIEAIEVLIREGQRERVTKVGHKRVLRACLALDLNDERTWRTVRAFTTRQDSGFLIVESGIWLVIES